MPFTLTMPKLSPTMENGAIAKWHKKEGDNVEANDLLFEVSTDKATVEYNALDGGFLRKILVQEGQEANVGEPVAIFTETKDEAIDIPEKAESKEKKPQEAVKPETKPEAPQETFSRSDRLKSSPLARKLASEQGIDLSKLEGSGPGGRIVSRDLSQAPKGKKAVAAPLIEAGTFEEEALTPIRKVIAERLQQAKNTIPHIYVTIEIDAAPLVNFREQLSHLDIKVSVNDLVVKGTSLALRDHPQVNSGFNPKNNTIIRYKSVDISIAVSVESGLITPIVTNADHKKIDEISTEIRALAKKAKEGKLQPKEFQGGSFTVSNLGMYGVSEFQAIINPPQAAILAVAGILDKPVVKNGKVEPGKTMNLTLSADHRVIDGVLAAQFLKTLQKYLENPVLLLL